jgi:hypothetical protein
MLTFVRLRLFLRDLRAIRRDEPNDVAGELGASMTKRATLIRVVMQCVISLLVLAFGFYAILRPDLPQQVKEVAAGFIGTVLGYWLS